MKLKLKKKILRRIFGGKKYAERAMEKKNQRRNSGYLSGTQVIKMRHVYRMLDQRHAKNILLGEINWRRGMRMKRWLEVVRERRKNIE